MGDLTNEEQRVEFYGDNKPPTNPASVTHDTPLESLNLNWREKDLRERERTKHVHRLHPYLGKFIPQLAEIFLRKYFSPGQTVFDPFAGSGTTLVQANELGIHAIGCDISAFNVLLCRVKTAHYDLKQVRQEVLDILEKTAAKTQQNRLAELPLFAELQLDEAPPNVHVESEYLKTWFAPQALFELITYRDIIEHEGYEYQDLLKVILSRSARSARLTTHFDLDFPKTPQLEPYFCYKHSRICSPTTEALKFLKRYSHDTLERIAEFDQMRSSGENHVYHADSRSVNLPPIDGVITSPPYVGLIDYHEQHIYAYHLLGLEDRRAQEIGPAAQGVSQKAREAYRKDMVRVFQNVLQSMPGGGPIIVVAGDKHNLYSEIARELDVHQEAVVQRHVNRRTGRRASEFYESIFIWRKI